MNKAFYENYVDSDILKIRIHASDAVAIFSKWYHSKSCVNGYKPIQGRIQMWTILILSNESLKFWNNGRIVKSEWLGSRNVQKEKLLVI